jgi:hypothetical protein
MGIKNLGKTNVPSIEINWFDVVGVCKHPVPPDVANLMFNVLWCHAPNACHGDCDQALRQLNKFFKFFQSKNLKLPCVLDGKASHCKAPEDGRRQEKRIGPRSRIEEAFERGTIPTLLDHQACVSNAPRFIALVAKLLEHLKLPFVVASDEADGTLAALATEGVAVSHDSDLLAHGAKQVVRVSAGGGWCNGEAKLVSMEIPSVTGGTQAPLLEVFNLNFWKWLQR